MADESKNYCTVYFSDNNIRVLDRFDEFYDVDRGGSRSPRIIEAMELLMSVDKTLTKTGLDLDPGVPKRSYVTQALATQARYEAGDLVEADD